MGFVLRRVAWAPLVFLAVAAITCAVPRVTRQDLYPGPVYPGVGHDLDRMLLHFDFGRACAWPGCPAIHDMWMRDMARDLYLLGGCLVLGVAGGVAGGLFCATRERSLAGRALQTLASILYCTPVYVMGLGLLLLFNSTFGIVPVPAFFDADPRWVSPVTDPWDWFRALLVPWLVLAAPLAAMCLRLTVATVRETLDEDYVRTAVAKGLPPGRVIRRHAAPPSHVTTASFVGVTIPLIVTNMVLVERVLAVPGFFRYTWKAVGHVPEPALPTAPDLEMLKALTIWGAVLIIVAGLLVDAAILWLDPRIRAAGYRLG